MLPPCDVLDPVGLALGHRHERSDVFVTGIGHELGRRAFLDDLGRSPKAWLNEQRMIAARNLLFEGHSVKMVGCQLGFKQTSHFCREFKRSYCMTPSQFLSVKTDAARRFAELSH